MQGGITGPENALVNITGFFEMISFEISLPIIIGCVLLAFFGLKLYRICMAAAGAYSFGFAAYYGSVLLVVAGIMPNLLDGKLCIILALSAALIGLALGCFLDKVVLFIAGAAGGYFGTQLLAGLFFADLMSPIVLIIISAVIGVIIGILLCVIFKPTYIIVTSVGGMAMAGFIIGLFFYPINSYYILIFVGAGALIGIIPAIFQFKYESDRRYR